MELYEVVKKLYGPIEPVGETQSDEKRFENLKKTIDLVESLINDIWDVSEHEISHEFSVKRSGDLAVKWLKDSGITDRF